MNRPLNVLVLDDNPVTALGPINGHLALGPGDPRRFTLSNLSDPGGLDKYLDEHPEVDVVLVDVEFGPEVTRTCLTAFQSLIRRNGPKAIGLSQSDYGRTLFPFAVCQLLPPPTGQTVVGWTYKDDRKDNGYPELIRILDAIGSGQVLARPRTLERCMPDAAVHTGEFMQKILSSRLDVRLWSMMSATHYEADVLGQTASVSTSAVRQRFDVYLQAIGDFEVAMQQDASHPIGPRAILNLPSQDAAAASGKRAPRQRAIESFAQAHRKFFQAPELEAIVVERALRRSRNLGRSGRRRSPEPWWKTNPSS